MAVLDNLTGYEFEDLMADVFRKLGYENVRVIRRSGDEGRDIIMEEVIDGTRRAVIVECKHTNLTGRPVVQKLHSAVATFDFDGQKRGILVTTGRVSGPAEDYVDRIRRNNDPNPIEIIDGSSLRDIGEDIGLDLYNGRIEILCDKTLRPFDRKENATEPVEDVFQDIRNLKKRDLPQPQSWVTFEPVLVITAKIDSSFETTVGVIHRINEIDELVIFAERDGPTRPTAEIRELISNNLNATIGFEEERFEEVYDDVDVKHFDQSETEYKEWAIDRLRDAHTTTVSYTGDNNVTYEKTCRPNISDVIVRDINPVYFPHVETKIKLGDYGYRYIFYAAGPSRKTIRDDIHRCVHCSSLHRQWAFWRKWGQFTYCDNCGSINCRSHIKTERTTKEPVCIGCAVTDRFFLKRKYFFDDENLEEFKAQYREMPIYERALENKPFVVSTVLAVSIVFTLMSIFII